MAIAHKPAAVALTTAVLMTGACGSTATTSPSHTTSSSAPVAGLDVGVRRMEIKPAAVVTSIKDLEGKTTVTGTVVSEAHGPIDGEVDSFGALHLVAVRVTSVVSGSEVKSGDTVNVENGVYE